MGVLVARNSDEELFGRNQYIMAGRLVKAICLWREKLSDLRRRGAGGMMGDVVRNRDGNACGVSGKRFYAFHSVRREI